MKILFVTATYLPSTNGVAISLSNLKKTLENLGHEAVILAPDNPDAKPEKGVIRYPSVPNPIITDYPVPLFPLTPGIFKKLEAYKFDVVHAQHPFYISFVADVISSRKNIPFIFTYHTKYGDYINSVLGFLGEKTLDFIEKYSLINVLTRSDLIIAPSNAVRDHILSLGTDKKVVVIPSGLPKFSEVKLTKNELRSKYNLPSDKKIILCLSRIGVEKNSAFLLSVIKDLPKDYYLVYAGTGPQLNELQEKSVNWKIDDRVSFLGKIEYSKVSEVYSLADVFVFPSSTETQGVVLLEAQRFGLPVVAIDTKVNREWVLGHGGVICKGEVASFCKNIDYVYSNKIKFSKKGKVFASGLDVETTTKKVIAEYKKLIKK